MPSRRSYNRRAAKTGRRTARRMKRNYAGRFIGKKNAFKKR